MVAIVATTEDTNTKLDVGFIYKLLKNHNHIKNIRVIIFQLPVQVAQHHRWIAS